MEFNLLENYKEILGIIAIILTFIAFIPYIKSILAGKTKPHVFSWVIWGISTFMVFFAQIADDGGAGAWSIGVSGIITMSIAVLAYFKKADITITKSDWLFFIVALSAIPLWYITSDPLWAVIILTSTDITGFLPTIRKAFFKPFEENLFFYVFIAIRNLVSITALENYSLTTVLFPASVATTCVIFISIVVYRRRVMSTKQKT